MINALVNSGVCSVLVSEENEDPIIVPDDKSGKYCVAFDPLDGSSNIDCNVSVGTIFSVYEKTGNAATVDDLLRSGAHCVCAGYCAYSSAVELVFTFRGGSVEGFCLDPTIGEFVHTRVEMMFPRDGGKKIYSCNEGNYNNWDKPIQDAVQVFKSGEKGTYSGRYVGSMVADIHRTLLYGGIYLYPADNKNAKGKLRCLYEGIPMAMIIEQAGGIASTGLFEGKIGRVLKLTPDEIHCKCPIIMGGPRDIAVVYEQYKKAGVEVPALPSSSSSTHKGTF